MTSQQPSKLVAKYSGITPTSTEKNSKAPRRVECFTLGECYATQAVVQVLRSAELEAMTLVQRHHGGDWGDLCKEDIQANESAIREGHRILSAYTIAGKKVYVITEANRSVTTVLLASEY
jgi:hypothetical protein